MSTNSTVGCISGIVSYTDGSHINFHSQIDSRRNWSLDGDTQQAIADLTAAYGNKVKSILDAIPGVSDVTVTPIDKSDKTVNDAVVQLSVTITDSNGSKYPISATFERGEQLFHALGSGNVDNGAIDKLLQLASNLSPSPVDLESDLQFKVVDQSNDGIEKRILIFILNVEDAGTTLAYQNLKVGSDNAFNFDGTTYITGTVGGTTLSQVAAVNGRKYSIANGVITDIGAATAGTRFQVVNNSGSIAKLRTVRNGRGLEKLEVSPGVTIDVRYRQTFWAYVVPSSYVVDDGTYGDLVSLINTEISPVGVAKAHLVITKSMGVYQFSLSNIVYS